MLDPYVRNILFYDFLLLHTPNDGPIVPLIDVLRHLKQRVDSEDSKKLIQNGTEQISIRKLEFAPDQRTAFILFNYGNSLVTDPAFIHLDNGAIRIAEKQEREGVAVSAHMAISLVATAGHAIRYKALLEDIPGIGKSKIAPFLNTEISNSTNYTFKDRDGITKTIRLTPDLQVHEGKMLREAFANGGALTGLELIRYRNEGDWDEEGRLIEEKSSIILKVDREKDPNIIDRILSKVKSKGAREGYSEMRLIWKEQSETGREKQRSTRVGIARQDTLDAVFGEQEEIKVDAPQPQCRDTLCDEVCGHLQNMLHS